MIPLAAWMGAPARATLAALLAGWAIAALAPRDFAIGTFKDDAHYAVLAKAIRERHEYRVLAFPGRPPEVKYAPGWPAVLALAWKPGASGAENLERLRWVNLLLVGPLAAAIALAGMRVFKLSPALAAGAAVAGVAAPAELSWWTIPLSEPLCLALVALGLVLAEARRTRSAVATLALAVYVRSLAGPFLVAAIVAAAWKDGWRRAVRPALIGVALLLPWAAWVALEAHAVPPALAGAGYTTYASQYWQQFGPDPVALLCIVPWVNGRLVAEALGQAILGWHLAPRAIELLLGLAVAVLVGRAARAHRVFWIGLALYLLLVLFWPFPMEDRFVGSMWPLLLLGVLAAVPGARARWGLLAAAGLLVAVAFIKGKGVERHRQRSAAALPLLDSLRPRIPAGALVATSNPALVYLAYGNPTVPSWRERTYRWYRQGYWATAWGLGDDLWEIVRAFRPDYLMIERRGAEGRYAAGSLIRQCPGVLREVWSTPGGEYLFRVRSDVPCAPVTVKP